MGTRLLKKGTVTAFAAKLKHEGLMYRQLDKVQGKLVPVYLGKHSSNSPLLSRLWSQHGSYDSHVMGRRTGTQRFNAGPWDGI